MRRLWTPPRSLINSSATVVSFRICPFRVVYLRFPLLVALLFLCPCVSAPWWFKQSISPPKQFCLPSNSPEREPCDDDQISMPKQECYHRGCCFDTLSSTCWLPLPFPGRVVCVAGCEYVQIERSGLGRVWTGPGNYGNDEYSLLEIVGPAQVVVDEISVQKPRTCDNDYLIIDKQRICTVPDEPITVTPGPHPIEWLTDHSVTNLGFSFHVLAEEVSPEQVMNALDIEKPAPPLTQPLATIPEEEGGEQTPIGQTRQEAGAGTLERAKSKSTFSLSKAKSPSTMTLSKARSRSRLNLANVVGLLPGKAAALKAPLAGGGTRPQVLAINAAAADDKSEPKPTPAKKLLIGASVCGGILVLGGSGLYLWSKRKYRQYDPIGDFSSDYKLNVDAGRAVPSPTAPSRTAY